MAQSQDDKVAEKHTSVPIGPRAVAVASAAPPPPTSSSSTIAAAPCGACKFLRRKCIGGCIFAPHFGPDQGAARFAAVHKVFGASNVSKLLLHIPVNRRHDAVVTISYEAQARLSDPVYGCVSTILALKQQVASLQAELAMVQTQLINSRLAVMNALQSSQQQQQTQHISLMMQPSYSSNSSASNNLVNVNGFADGFEFGPDTAPSSHTLEPLGFSNQPSQYEEEEEEEESQNPRVLANQILHSR